MGYVSHIKGCFDDPRDVKKAIEEGKLDKLYLAIGWKADKRGYTVNVSDASMSEIVCEYHAGNSPWDSQMWVSAEDGVDEAQLREWARQTAGEWADEIGLPQSVVFEEED